MVQNKRYTSLVIIVVILLFGSLVSGCGARETAQSASPLMNAAAPAGGVAESAYLMAEVAPATAPASAPAVAAEANAAFAQGVVQDGAAFARKVIARATMTLVVDDAEPVVEQIQVLVADVGGYVANANLYKNDYGADARLQGTLTLRVPADQLEGVMAQLEAMAVDVNNKTINREDVTDQYSDVEAQLRNLTAAEEELREMLAEVRAKPNAKPEDILTVYNHLSNIRSQIEQLQGRKNMFDNLIGLSTLDLTLTPNMVTLPVVEEGWQPNGVVRDALRELVSTLQGLGDMAIWIGIYLLPVLIIILIGGWIVWTILRTVWRLLRRRKPVPAG